MHVHSANLQIYLGCRVVRQLYRAYICYTDDCLAGNSRGALAAADQYGSPSLDEVTEFSRSLAAALEAELGQEEAGDIEVEVSSAVRKSKPVLPVHAALSMTLLDWCGEHTKPDTACALCVLLAF